MKELICFCISISQLDYYGIFYTELTLEYMSYRHLLY